MATPSVASDTCQSGRCTLWLGARSSQSVHYTLHEVVLPSLKATEARNFDAARVGRPGKALEGRIGRCVVSLPSHPGGTGYASQTLAVSPRSDGVKAGGGRVSVTALRARSTSPTGESKVGDSCAVEKLDDDTAQ